MITHHQRQQFDDILESIIAELPEHLHARLDEIPVVVEDRPTARQLRDLGMDTRGTLLCGLHWGVALTDRSVEHSGRLPDQISLFREPIMMVSGFGRRSGGGSLRDLQQQIRITLLHEMGHHVGLDEDDLAALGYG